MISLRVRVATIIVLSALGVSCVVAPPKSQIDSSPSSEIQDIRVVEEDGKMTIEVEGEEPMIYTTFHLSDPDRLVIDMAGVGLGRFNEEILVETGPVRAIRPTQGGGDNVARLEFLLDDSVETNVKTEGLRLVVEVTESEQMKSKFTAFEEGIGSSRQEIVSPPTAVGLVAQPVAGLAAVPAALATTEGSAEATLPATDSEQKKAMNPPPAGELSPESMEKGGTPPLPIGTTKPESDSKNIDPPPLVPLSPSAAAPDTLSAKPANENTEEEDALAEGKLQKEVQENEDLSREINKAAEKPRASEEAPLAQGMKPLPKATRVKSIQWIRDKDLQLIVTSDGALSPSVFFVDSQRLVIDLPGVEAENRQPNLQSDDVYIKQVRIGQHEKKLRLVIDLNAPIHYDWELDKNQLKVTLSGLAEDPALPPFAEMSGPAKGAVTGGSMTADKAAQAPSPAVPKASKLPALPPSLPAGSTEKPASPAEVEETASDTAKKDNFLKRIRQNEASSKLSAATAQKILDREAAANILPQGYVGKKISLDFQDADTTNIIRLIAEVSGLNFVVADDVTGKVTMKLNDVPWDQALDIILEMHNLGKVREGNIIRVATLANLSKQRDEEARAKETKIKAEDLLTRVIYVNYAKADDMQSLLTKLLSSRGEIVVDKRTNALIVKDIKDNLNEVERLSKKMDTKTPQVLIEARIAEVKPVFLRSLGIKWGAGYNATTGGNLVGIGNSANTSPVNAGVPDFAVNLPASTSLGGIGFTFGRFTQNPFTLDLRLSAGETQALTRVVSTPKIMVLDNHEALIEQGESVPFSTVSQEGTQVQFIDANLTLKVTPHISPDGGILLDVHLSKNEAGPVSPGAPGPPIFKKEVTTNVLLMNGETMVIGGIYETKKTESESGIPWLKELPLVGWLFKNKETREDTSELLVFLTPKVMD